jgi:hypothetical protein
MTSLSFEPLIPGALWLALAAVGVAMLGWYALRRPPGMPRGRWVTAIALMFVCLATVLFVLLNPTWVREIPPPAGKPLLTLLVDASASMAVNDGESGKNVSRYQAAARTASSLADELSDRFDVRVRTFSDRAASADARSLAGRTPDGAATDLTAALADALAEERAQGQAVVLLSDGIDNVSNTSDPRREILRRAKALAAPVYTRTFGTNVGGVDLAIKVIKPQDLAFIGQRVPVSVRVEGRGIVRGARVQVSLLHGDKEIATQEIEFTDSAGGTARFTVTQEKAGLFPYEVRVAAVPGESTTANNSATYLLRTIDQPVRVLLLEGKPYWDSKFLVRTLSGIPAVELDSLVRVAEGRMVFRSLARASSPTSAPASQPSEGEAAPAVATTRAESWKIVNDAADALANPERLKAYQIVVLGRESEAFLTEQALANLQTWISRDGGALVCARGSPTAQINQRLAKMLPVKWTPTRESRFRMKLTDEGRGLRWLGEDSASDDVRLAGLPTLASSAQLDRSKAQAVVLATSVAPDGGAENPAVIYQKYGLGRVVVIEGAGMWRWAFLPPQYQQKEEVYGALWQSLLQWLSFGSELMPGQKLLLRMPSVVYSPDKPASAMLQVREEAGKKEQAPQVELIGPSTSGAAKAFTPVLSGDQPGAYRVDFGQLTPGRYQARVAGAEATDSSARTVFDVRVDDRERTILDARPDVMREMAQESGGAELVGDAAGDVSKKFKEHLARVRPPRYERATAWDTPWMLVAVFVLWTASWAIRRSSGLV